MASLTLEQKLSGLRYTNPQPPNTPDNVAWLCWKVRDDKRRKVILNLAGLT